MSILSTGTRDQSEHEGEEHWISVSDLMSALMMVFMMLAVFFIAYSSQFQKEQLMEQKVLLVKTSELATELAGSQKLLGEKSRLLTEATSEITLLFDKSGILEEQLARVEKLITEKDQLLSQTTHEIKTLSVKSGDLEAQLADAEKLLGEKDQLLTETTDEIKALFDKSGDLEAKLAGVNKLLAEKDQLLVQVTKDVRDYNALFDKSGDLEAKLTGAIKLLGEKDQLLSKTTLEIMELSVKSGILEAQLAGAEKLLGEKDQLLGEKERLLIQATEDNRNYNALFDTAGDLEAKLAGAEKLLGEKERLLGEKERLLLQATEDNRNYNALFDKAGDLEAKLAGAEKLLGEKDQLLVQVNAQLQAVSMEEQLKAEQLAKVASQAVIYDDVIKELRQSLLGEFNPDMKKWNAELRDDLTFRFNEPSVLFGIGETTIKPKFQGILDDFFPRYLKVITSEKFRADIAEVRIEGHTSSFWGDLDSNSQQAYFYNMELSQGRSRNVLFYVTQLPTALGHTDWLKEKLTANGLSSSKLVDRNGFLLTNPDSTGKENSAKSQRVEFRVRIDAESKISRIIDAGNEVKHE